MEHPSIEDIEQYRKGKAAPNINDHIDNCELCSSVADGLEKLKFLSSSNKIEVEKIVSNAKEVSERQIKGSIKINRNKPNKILLYAACLIALVGFFTVYLTLESSSSVIDQELLKVYPAPQTLRSIEENSLNRFSELYKKGQYQEALNVIETFEERGLKDFYKAMILIQTTPPDYNEAIFYLEGTYVESSIYKEDSQFYLALCYSKTGEIEKALTLLNQILNTSQHSKKEVVQKVIEEVNLINEN